MTGVGDEVQFDYVPCRACTMHTFQSKTAKLFDQLMKSKIRSHIIIMRARSPSFFGVPTATVWCVLCVHVCRVLCVLILIWCVVLRKKNWNRQCKPSTVQYKNCVFDARTTLTYAQLPCKFVSPGVGPGAFTWSDKPIDKKNTTIWDNWMGHLISAALPIWYMMWHFAVPYLWLIRECFFTLPSALVSCIRIKNKIEWRALDIRWNQFSNLLLYQWNM